MVIDIDTGIDMSILLPDEKYHYVCETCMYSFKSVHKEVLICNRCRRPYIRRIQ